LPWNSVFIGAFHVAASDDEDAPEAKDEDDYAEPTGPSEEGKAEIAAASSLVH